MAGTSPYNNDMLDGRRRWSIFSSPAFCRAYALTSYIAPQNGGLAVKAVAMEI